MKKSKNKNKQSAVIYTGKLTIEKKFGDKTCKVTKIHNTGCEPLFAFLANCLASVGPSSTGFEVNKPRFIRGFFVDNPKAFDKVELSPSYEALKTFVPCSKISKDKLDSSNDDFGYSVKYTFMINHNMFKPDTIEEEYEYMRINVFAVYNTDNVVSRYNNPSAYIVLENEEDWVTHSELANYILTWDMQISNNSED